jgi:hypothetical protein
MIRYFLAYFLLFIGCKESTKNRVTELTTLDSNVIISDTSPAILNLDNLKSGNGASITLDSAAPIINPTDTTYSKH